MKIFPLFLFLLLLGGVPLSGCDNSNEGEAPPPPPPAPTDPADYSPENVCDAEFCATDAALSQTCDTFLANCIAANPDQNTEECVAGGLAICQNPEVPPGGVCTYGLCADPIIGGQCQTWLDDCLLYSNSDDECYGAMLFYCRVQE